MSTTKNEIIYLADLWIRTKGYNAFSYTDIAVPMNIRKPAIHYYFPQKSDLGKAVIEQELERIHKLKTETDDLPGDQQLQKIAETFYRRSRQRHICLNGSLTSDFETLSPEMQDKVQEMCRSVLDQLTCSLEKGRKEGNLHFSGEAADQALLVVSGLLSSLLLARVLGEEVFDRMIDQLFMGLGSSIRVAQFPEYIPEHLK